MSSKQSNMQRRVQKWFDDPKLKDAVYWIAMNDGAGDDTATDVKAVAGMVTVLLVADVFCLPAIVVAEKIVEIRLQKANEHAPEEEEV